MNVPVTYRAKNIVTAPLNDLSVSPLSLLFAHIIKEHYNAKYCLETWLSMHHYILMVVFLIKTNSS